MSIIKPILRTIVKLFLVNSVTAATIDYVVVLSADLAPYRAAAGEVLGKMGREGYRGETVLLSKLQSIGLSEWLEAPGQRAFLATGTQAAVWLHDHLPDTYPLVYCLVASPEQHGLTDGRCRGISTDIPFPEQIKIMRQALPDLRSIGIIYDRSDDGSRHRFERFQSAVPPELNLQVQLIDNQVGAATVQKRLFASGVDIVWTDADPAVYTSATIKSLLLNSLRYQIPVFGFSIPFVKSGALIGLGVTPEKQGRQAAAILRDSIAEFKRNAQSGTTAGSITYMPEFDIAVNLIVAQQLSIVLTDSFLDSVHHVIK